MNEIYYNLEDNNVVASEPSGADAYLNHDNRPHHSLAEAGANADEVEEIDGIRLHGRYTAKQAASLIQISRTTFFCLVKAGKIKRRYTQISTRPYYLGRDLLRLINRI